MLRILFYPTITLLFLPLFAAAETRRAVPSNQNPVYVDANVPMAIPTAVSNAPRFEDITAESITIIPIENSDAPVQSTRPRGQQDAFEIPQVIPVDGSPIRRAKPNTSAPGAIGMPQGLLEAVPLYEKGTVKPLANRQEIEVLLSRAIVAFYNKKYQDSKQLLAAVIEKNAAVFLAHEYLAHILTIERDYVNAVARMQGARAHEPQSRLGSVYFYIGDLYMRLQRLSTAQKFFEAAKIRNGFPAASRYYLGYLAYKQEQWREAHGYFYEALELAKNSKSAYDRELLQPIRFYLAQLNLRLGFPRYALGLLHEISTESVQLKNEPIKQLAWNLEEALDQGLHRASALLYFQYDSNVAGFTNHQSTAPGVSTRAGFGEVIALNLDLQSSPSRSWSYGADLTSVINRHEGEELSTLDSWSNIPALWLSWWNRKELEIRLRYDFSHTMLDRTSYKLFLQTHGPLLTATYFWDQKKRLDFSYSHKRNYSPNDAARNDAEAAEQRSGYEHQFALKGSFFAASPDWQPFAQYIFNDNHASGQNFVALSHAFEFGTGYWIKNFAFASASLAYTFTNFPFHKSDRRDHSFFFHMQGQYPLSNNWNLLADFSYFINTSNIESRFTYNRTQFNFGCSYTFMF